MKKIIPIIVIFFSIFIQGCPPPSYGLYRYHNIQTTEVPILCIENTIKSVADVTYHGHEQKDGGRTLTLSGLLPPDQVHRFTYSYKNKNNSITIVNRTDNGLQYHHTATSSNKEQANLRVSTFIQVINEIDSKIESNCSFKGLTNEASFSCDVEACNGSI